MLAFEKHLPQVWLREPPERWILADLGGLAGRTLGLVGIGGIGEALARRALAFEMDVIALRRRSLPAPLPGVRMVESLAELLPACDHLVLAAPLTARTQHLLDADAFELVRPGVHLVNVARGGLVDHDVLRCALDDGRVAMATSTRSTPNRSPPVTGCTRTRTSASAPSLLELAAQLAAQLLELYLNNLGRYLAAEPLLGVADPRSSGTDPDSADHLFDSRLQRLIRWRRWR